jgi:23S rRNA (pseudouridine1915-N3)-methyltransferase
VNARILTVSRKQPDWINEGFQTYARRLQSVMPLELTEISPVERKGQESARQIDHCRQQEAMKIRSACRTGDYIIALDESGKQLDTVGLARFVGQLRDDARAPVFVIGGADGLHPAFLAEATSRLALSSLTLPHGLVRIVLAEALYRAVSLLNNHPYHRA